MWQTTTLYSQIGNLTSEQVGMIFDRLDTLIWQEAEH